MGRRERGDTRWISDGMKSLAVAAVFMFVFFVLFQGDLERWSNGIVGGRAGISFCRSWLADAPVLELLPCFVLNLTVVVSTMIVVYAGVMLLRAGANTIIRR